MRRIFRLGEELLASQEGIYPIESVNLFSWQSEIKAELMETIDASSQNCEKGLIASSCLSIRMDQLGSQWKNFNWIW